LGPIELQPTKVWATNPKLMHANSHQRLRVKRFDIQATQNPRIEIAAPGGNPVPSCRRPAGPLHLWALSPATAQTIRTIKGALQNRSEPQQVRRSTPGCQE
jgi:hypothetical protein